MSVSVGSGVFNPPGSDWTVRMFDQIFGAGWQNFMSGTSSTLSVLGNMALIFNGIILSVVVMLAGYHFLTAVVESSHSGIPMGKKYHSYWFPVRSALSFIMVGPLPTFKGLCVIQVLVLFLIYKSIGAADVLLNTTASYFVKSGGQLTLQTTVPADRLARGVLRTLVLRDYIVERTSGAVADKPLILDLSPTSSTGTGITGNNFGLVFPITIKSGGATTITLSQELGYVHIQCTALNKATYCSDILKAVESMAATMTPLAAQLATPPSIAYNIASASGVKISTVTPPPTSITDAGEYGTAIDTYQADFSGALANAETQLNPIYEIGLKQWAYSAAKVNGWASLGGWYIQLDNLQTAVRANIDELPQVVGPDVMKIGLGYIGYDYPAIKANMTEFMSIYTQKYGAVGSSGATLDAGKEGWLVSLAGSAKRFIDKESSKMLLGPIDKTLYTISGHTLTGSTPVSPITEITNLGHYIIGIGEVAEAGSLFGKSAVADVPIAGTVVKMISKYAWYIIAAGMVLAFGVPYYPFLMWLVAIATWFILCLETWIAAPLWGATHMEVSGEGFAGTRARQGYFLFFGVLIRPALMVFSFVISVVVTDVLLWLMATMMEPFLSTLMQNHVVGIATWIAVLTMVVGTTGIILSIAGGIPLWMPNRVLDWLGQLISPLDSIKPNPSGIRGLAGIPTRGAGLLSKESSNDKGGGKGGGEEGGTDPSAAQTEADRAAYVKAAEQPGADGAKVASETGQNTSGTDQAASSLANASPPGDSSGESGGVGPEPANTAGAGGGSAEGGAGGAAATAGETSAADVAVIAAL